MGFATKMVAWVTDGIVGAAVMQFLQRSRKKGNGKAARRLDRRTLNEAVKFNDFEYFSTTRLTDSTR